MAVEEETWVFQSLTNGLSDPWGSINAWEELSWRWVKLKTTSEVPVTYQRSLFDTKRHLKKFKSIHLSVSHILIYFWYFCSYLYVFRHIFNFFFQGALFTHSVDQHCSQSPLCPADRNGAWLQNLGLLKPNPSADHPHTMLAEPESNRTAITIFQPLKHISFHLFPKSKGPVDTIMGWMFPKYSTDQVFAAVHTKKCAPDKRGIQVLTDLAVTVTA